MEEQNISSGWNDESAPSFFQQSSSLSPNFFPLEQDMVANCEENDTPGKINMFANKEENGGRLTEVSCAFLRKGQGNHSSANSNDGSNLSSLFEPSEEEH